MQIQAFFSNETVSFSDYFAQLVSPNFKFQRNMFSQGEILKGSLYLSAVPVLDEINKAGGGRRNHIFSLLTAVVPKLPSCLQADPSSGGRFPGSPENSQGQMAAGGL